MPVFVKIQTSIIMEKSRSNVSISIHEMSSVSEGLCILTRMINILIRGCKNKILPHPKLLKLQPKSLMYRVLLKFDALPKNNQLFVFLNWTYYHDLSYFLTVFLKKILNHLQKLNLETFNILNCMKFTIISSGFTITLG